MNAGEYDKVIQGCQEILEIEPGNTRALALLKKAEEDKNQSVMPETPQNPPTAEPTNNPDPLAELQVEDTASKAPNPGPDQDPELWTREDRFSGSSQTSTRSMLLALLIPAALVILIGGALIMGIAAMQRNRTIDDQNSTPYDPIEHNQERVEDIKAMNKVIQDFFAENGDYPALSQVERIFKQSDEIGAVPQDPRHGEMDKAGKYFAYTYTLYETASGHDYVLSALFEDNEGFGNPWSRGANPKRYEDFRDFESAPIEIIGDDFRIQSPSENDVEQREDGPRVRVQ